MAYWYQMEEHKPFHAFPIAGQRIPLRVVKPVRMYEAEKLKFKLDGLKASIVDMSDEGPDWGDNRQLVIESRKNSAFELEVNGLIEPNYNLNLYYSKGPEYGDADVYINGNFVGEIKGYSPYMLPSGRLTVKNLTTATGSAYFRFVISGKDPYSKGYYIGLDGISIEPKRSYIPDWYIIGPFPNPHNPGSNRRGLDSVYLPEKLVDLSQNYQGAGSELHKWKYIKTPATGNISLSDYFIPSEMAVAYAVTYVFSPDNRNVKLFVGSDDGCKVFLNDKQLYRYLGERMAEPDQAEVDLSLKPGWNKLLLKIENNIGSFNFYARLLNTDNQLIVSANRSTSTNQIK